MKRLLCVLMVCSLAGCTIPGLDPPQAAPTGDPFANSVRFDDLMKNQEIATASSAATVKQLGEMHETHSQHLEATQATNTLLSKLIDQQKTVVGQQCDMLKEIQALKQTRAVAPPALAKTEPALSVLNAPPVIFDPDSTLKPIDGVPAGSTVSVGGTVFDLGAFLAQWYKRPWSHPGSIDEHLKSHSVDLSSVAGLSDAIKEQLHAAIHERKKVTVPLAGKAVSHPPVFVPQAYQAVSHPPVFVPQAYQAVSHPPVFVPQAYQAAPSVRSNCPNGSCPQQITQSWSYSGPVVRRSLFGRRR